MCMYIYSSLFADDENKKIEVLPKNNINICFLFKINEEIFVYKNLQHKSR